MRVITSKKSDLTVADIPQGKCFKASNLKSTVLMRCDDLYGTNAVGVGTGEKFNIGVDVPATHVNMIAIEQDELDRMLREADGGGSGAEKILVDANRELRADLDKMVRLTRKLLSDPRDCLVDCQCRSCDLERTANVLFMKAANPHWETPTDQLPR